MLARAHALLVRLSLHRRIAVFVSSILLAVFLAFGYVGWEAVNRSTEATLQERHATTRVVARHLDDLIGHAHSHLVVVARELATQNGNVSREQTEQILERSLQQLRFFFTHLLVFDLNGRLVASTPSATLESVDGDVKATLDEALQSGRPTISNLLRLPVGGAVGVLFVAPIVQEDRVTGVVAGEMRLPHASISTVATVLELGQTGHMEVIDRKGLVLASTNAQVVAHRSEHQEFYAPLLAARQSTVGRARDEHEGESDEWHIMAFVPLATAPWGVGLGQDEGETFAATRELRDRTLTVAAFALALALYFAWVGTRSVVNPIGALTRAGERMATGDLSVPIHVEQRDEVGRLAQVLEVMRQRHAQSLAEITAWNRELEQRVHERTRELEISNRHLQALIAVATAASRGPDIQDVLSKALQELVDTLSAHNAWAFLWDKEQQQLRLVASHRLPEQLRLIELTVACPDAACMVALYSPTVISELQEACPALPKGLIPGTDQTSCWCTPIRIGDEPLGTLCLAIPADRALEADETALMAGVAHQVAMAFENARLTEDKARLEAGRRLELLRAEFLASVSHELRTPLGFIKGYTTTLLRDDVAWDPAEQREFLQIVDEEADRLKGLVDSLLDAARAQAGRFRLDRQPVQIESVLRRSVDRMAASLGRLQVELHLEVSPTIVADGPRLEQVVVNLVQNAAKYSPNGGPIEVHLALAEPGVRISVLDRGVGVTAEEAARIFEPFYRVLTGPTASVGGAGLGLAICRAIVEAHGGRIWAEPRPSGGTAVYLTLPLGTDETGETVDDQEVRARS